MGGKLGVLIGAKECIKLGPKPAAEVQIHLAAGWWSDTLLRFPETSGQRSSVVELLICNQPVGGSSPSAGSCRSVGRQLSTFLRRKYDGKGKVREVARVVKGDGL